MKMRYLLILAILTGLIISDASASSENDINLNRIEKNFWDNGNIRLIRYYSLSGILKETSVYDKTGSLERLIHYDRFGNRIAESHYNPDGTLKATKDGWASVRWEYRGKHLYRVSYFDDRGEIIECKEYNESGELAEDISSPPYPVEYVEEIKKPSVLAGSETLSY